MSVRSPARRRDDRFRPHGGTAFVEYTHPAKRELRRARLTDLSVAGLSFEIETVDLEPGMIIPEIILQVGDFHLAGDLLVKNVRQVDGCKGAVGGLFYPPHEDGERQLMTLLAGIQAVQNV